MTIKLHLQRYIIVPILENPSVNTSFVCCNTKHNYKVYLGLITIEICCGALINTDIYNCTQESHRPFTGKLKGEVGNWHLCEQGCMTAVSEFLMPDKLRYNPPFYMSNKVCMQDKDLYCRGH